MIGTRTARITLDGRLVDYRLACSLTARKLRVRVGPQGVEVVQPRGRTVGEVRAFLRSRRRWLLAQVDRVARLRNLRTRASASRGDLLYRGEWVRVRVAPATEGRGANRVCPVNGTLVIRVGRSSGTAPLRSLENWLRKQARTEVQRELGAVVQRIKVAPGRVYIMGQRTKWGNCSPLRNLSFNWRLIMAPAFVLRYLVTHEAVHLAVPDHSRRFWLTVRSLCPDEERARQWLVAHGNLLLASLATGTDNGSRDEKARRP